MTPEILDLGKFIDREKMIYIDIQIDVEYIVYSFHDLRNTGSR